MADCLNSLEAGMLVDSYRIEAPVARSGMATIYRALERYPMNRYATAREFARELAHLDQVGVENRRELQDWRKRKAHLPRRIILYVALLLVPVAILIAMALFSRHE
jgi:hypothetical protein